MPAHVVLIGKHRFVSGLFWQSLSRPRELRKEAAELGRRIKSDLMVLRKDYGTAQAGYGSTAEGLKPGMLSLGAAVAKTVSIEGAHYDGRLQPVPNWLAALKLPDGRWVYFAVRDESFLPTGDFAGTREEVIERLGADYALGGWNVVFGDEELRSIGFHNFHARRIEEFLPYRRSGDVRVHAWWALQPLSGRRRMVLLASCVGGAAALAAASAWWHTHATPGMPGSALEAARQAVSPPPPPPPHPWPTEPLPTEFAHACLAHLQHVSPGGWQLDTYSCDARLASHAWKRGSSIVGHLLNQVPDAVVALDGNTATLAQPMGVPGSGRDEALRQARQVLPALVSDLQALGIVPHVVAVPAPAPPPRAAGNLTAPPPPGPPDWQTFRVSLKTNGLPPTALLSAIDKPGLRLAKASFNGDEWTLEGVIYAK